MNLRKNNSICEVLSSINKRESHQGEGKSGFGAFVYFPAHKHRSSHQNYTSGKGCDSTVLDLGIKAVTHYLVLISNYKII